MPRIRALRANYAEPPSDIEDEIMPDKSPSPPPRPKGRSAAAKASTSKATDAKKSSGENTVRREGKKAANRPNKKGKGKSTYNSDDELDPPSPSAELVTGLELKRARLTGAQMYAVGSHSRGKMDRLREFRFSDPFDFLKDDRVDDYRFHTIEQAHFYNDVILGKKKKSILNQRYISWERCLSLRDSNMGRALHMLETKGLRTIMELKYDWNSEIIAQFFATLWITKGNAAENIPTYLNFMIEGVPYRCSYERFGKILGYGPEDYESKDLVSVHEYQRPGPDQIPIYHIDPNQRAWETANMKPYFRYLNSLIRQTVLPKGGNDPNVLGLSQTILSFLVPGFEPKFSVVDLIWGEILETSWNVKKSCTHAPYIMKVIDVVTKINFEKTVLHEVYKPKTLRRSFSSPSPAGASPGTQSPDHEPSAEPFLSAGGETVHTSSHSSERHNLLNRILMSVNANFTLSRDTAIEVEAIRKQQHDDRELIKRYVKGDDISDDLPPSKPFVPRRPPAQTPIAYFNENCAGIYEDLWGDVQQEQPTARNLFNSPTGTQGAGPSSSQAQLSSVDPSTQSGYDPLWDHYSYGYEYNLDPNAPATWRDWEDAAADADDS